MPWAAACQASLSMEFPRQEYWSWLPFPTPENFPDPEIEPQSPASQVDSLLTEPPGKPICVHVCTNNFIGSRIINIYHSPPPFFFPEGENLLKGGFRFQICSPLAILPWISYLILFCFMNHPSSFLYWSVEEIAWVKWSLFLDQILYLFQIFYYSLANHLIMRTAKVRERMSNSKNLLCLSV